MFLSLSSKTHMENELIKLSTDWARAELFSARIVWLFSAVCIVAAVGFWFFGRTAMAKAFIGPLIITGLFLVSVGAGLYFANKPRVTQFEQASRENPEAFLKKELERSGNSQKQLAVVFKVLPLICMASALIILLLPDSVNWRAIGITLILTASFLMVVDSNTDARNTMYHFSLAKLATTPNQVNKN